MAKDLYVKGYGRSRPRRNLLSPKKTVTLAIMLLAVLATWLFRDQLQQRIQPKPLPLTRHKVIRPLPSPPQPEGVAESKLGTPGAKLEQAQGATELELAMEAAAPSPTVEVPVVPENEGVNPQVEPVAEVSAEESGEGRIGKPENHGESGQVGANLKVEIPQEVIVLQVGAFRGIESAESVLHMLQGKGNQAYLDTRSLPNLGLVYRVRIRGYANIIEAKGDIERLRKDEGLECFIVKSTSDNPTSVRE